jgi:hypothetical protein
MIPVQNFAAGVLAGIIRRQPASHARTTFAWQVAVGAAIARATTVELNGDVLTVRGDERWAREITRAQDTILGRLRTLLGERAVARLQVEHTRNA